VNVRRQGLTIDQLGLAIRLANRLERLHLSEGQIESEFKRGIETKEFIKKVEDVCKLSSKIKVPVEELPSCQLT
jgi:hypothetical protein